MCRGHGHVDALVCPSPQAPLGRRGNVQYKGGSTEHSGWPLGAVLPLVAGLFSHHCSVACRTATRHCATRGLGTPPYACPARTNIALFLLVERRLGCTASARRTGHAGQRLSRTEVSPGAPGETSGRGARVYSKP